MKKTPFEFNQANNYYWNRQGKKHYWGVKGKDYGLLQSTLPNHDIIANNELEFLKYKHANFNQNQYQERPIQQPNKEIHKKQYQIIEKNPMDDVKEIKNQYSSEKSSPVYRIRTLPAQNDAEGRVIGNNTEHRRKHLSLMSRNIEISNSQTPKMDPTNRFSTLDFADEKERQLQEIQKKLYKRMNTEANINDNQIRKYRERIVKVVKRDRKNNPTFCNSLAYPLHCYRYLQ